jgi:hypothetical protein
MLTVRREASAMKERVVIACVLLACSMRATAAETVSYQYDAKGRLIAVVRTGSVNNGVTTTYDHDKADNRQRVVVTVASH